MVNTITTSYSQNSSSEICLTFFPSPENGRGFGGNIIIDYKGGITN